LEALAIEGYRQEALTQLQVRKLLGLSRVETEDFLAQHVDLYTYDPQELHREAEALERYARRSPR
jgi:predicted HTH domain antitoxin